MSMMGQGVIDLLSHSHALELCHDRESPAYKGKLEFKENNYELV